MDDKWLEITVLAPAQAVDLVCQELAELGTCGVRVSERQLDTFELCEEDEAADEPQSLRAYFAETLSAEELFAKVSARLEPLRSMFASAHWGEIAVARVEAADWAEGWKQNFPLLRIGRLVIAPSWEQYRPSADEVLVTLDPGMAFGTGTHETTRLCLEALVAALDECAQARVLDVGTGSGVLAMAAAALGAVEVLGCDIDPQACRVAADNVRLNGLEPQVRITDEPLEALGRDFHIVLANILAEENVRLADELTSRTRPGGWLILSGILREREAMVRAGFAPLLPVPPLVRHLGEWSCLVYRRSG